jgi:hypothetical protein
MGGELRHAKPGSGEQHGASEASWRMSRMLQTLRRTCCLLALRVGRRHLDVARRRATWHTIIIRRGTEPC